MARVSLEQILYAKLSYNNRQYDRIVEILFYRKEKMFPALDPALLNLTISDIQGIHHSTYLRQDVERFNPYQTIPNGITPPTYYECLSVLNTFMPLSCKGQRSYDHPVILDLDNTDGTTMALQTRYPKCIIYCSNLKAYSLHNGLDMYNVMGDKRTPRTIKEYLLMYNSRGADFAFCVDQEHFDLMRQVTHAIQSLDRGTILALRVSNFESGRVMRVIEYMLYWFKDVTIYKCATMSCVSNECYIVGIIKLHYEGDRGILHGLSEVKQFITDARNSIRDHVDNTDVADPLSLTNEYIGM